MALPPLHLSSLQNFRVKQALKLRQRRGRKRQSRILIDGRRAISCAVEGAVSMQEVFVSETRYKKLTEDDRQLLSACEAKGAQLCLLPPNLMARVSYGDHHEQFVATATLPGRTLAQLSLPERPLVAVVERLQKPGNLGAILRSADGAGMDAVILADGETDLFNPNVIRASLGTVFTMLICEATTEEVTEWLPNQLLKTYVARVDGSTDYGLCDFTQGTAIVLGSESDGVSSVWLNAEWKGIRIPMSGVADSLNVSNTAAIMFYEAQRQRRLLS